MLAFVDMDGVLCDFVGGICEWHGLPDLYADPANYGRWNIDDLSKMNEAVFWSPCSRQHFWRDLPWTSDGKQILEQVIARFGLARTYIWSTPTPNEDAYAGKLSWVATHVPYLVRRVVLGPAKHLVAQPGRVLIDDYDANCDRFVESGGSSVLVPRLWNRDHALPTVETTIARLEAICANV